MVIMIAGATHTGKTILAQRLLERYGIPYLSLDHLKMGLIRSGQTDLRVYDDDGLTAYLWPITREMIKTVIENDQHLVIEGIYIPFDWKKDFEQAYIEQIQYRCLIMTEAYIQRNFAQIKQYANVIETRLDDTCLTPEDLILDNMENLRLCKEHNCRYMLIHGDYEADIDIEHSINVREVK